MLVCLLHYITVLDSLLGLPCLGRLARDHDHNDSHINHITSDTATNINSTNKRAGHRREPAREPRPLPQCRHLSALAARQFGHQGGKQQTITNDIIILLIIIILIIIIIIMIILMFVIIMIMIIIIITRIMILKIWPSGGGERSPRLQPRRAEGAGALNGRPQS